MQLPVMFAHPTGWDNLLVGIIAATLLVQYRHQSITSGALKFLCVIGILDFVCAFGFGFTISTTPLQVLAFDQPNQVLSCPIGLIPLFLVPYTVIFHILSWTKLQRVTRGREQGVNHRLPELFNTQ